MVLAKPMGGFMKAINWSVFFVYAVITIGVISVVQQWRAINACLEAVELDKAVNEKVIEYNNEVVLYNQNVKKTNERALQQEKLQMF